MSELLLYSILVIPTIIVIVLFADWIKEDFD